MEEGEAATAAASNPAAATSRVTRLELGQASLSNLDEDGNSKVKFAHCSVLVEYDPEVSLK